MFEFYLVHLSHKFLNWSISVKISAVGRDEKEAIQLALGELQYSHNWNVEKVTHDSDF